MALDEKARDVRDLQQKEAEVRKDAEKKLLAEKETARELRDQAKLDSQKVFGLDKSLKLKEEELSSPTAKHLELGENHSGCPQS